MNLSQHPNAEAHCAVFERTCVGHLYMQTNEEENAVVHYRRMHDGALEEAGRTYAVHDDGSLSEHTRMTIPYNRPQGLAAF